MSRRRSDAAAEQHIKKLNDDQIFMDLLKFAQDTIGRATHDALLRFKWGRYGYNEGVAAVSFVLTGCLAVVNRDIQITPEEIGELVRERLIQIREEKEEDDE
jgi:hypothetical protein